MKKTYQYLLSVIFGGSLVLAGSCKKFDQLLQDPNRPTPESADVELYLSQIQLSFAGVFNTAKDLGSSLTRMEAFFGPTYQNAYSGQSFNGIWSAAYTGVMKNSQAMIPLAKAQAKYTHAGIAYVLQAYTMMTMVDLFGDVPFTEAVKGNENLNPKTEPGKDVYAKAIGLLDSAIANFNRPSASQPIVDLFYTTTGNAKSASWRRAAKTLKLRAYINTRLVDNTVGAKIEALFTEGDIITTDAQEFTFRFGSRQSNPNNRHPNYNSNYVASGGAGDYIGTYFMYALTGEKPVADPRRRYYLYRQILATPGTQQQQPCAYNPPPAHYPSGTPYCYLPGGYWGRDHGDNSGIPPDGQQRTVWGVYPAGGKFDAGEGARTTLNEGGLGAGIHPLWMSFFTDFVRAEAVLTIPGVTGNPRALLDAGIRKSIARVLAFPAQIGTTAAIVPTSTAIDNYVNYVLSQYDAATTDDQRLDVILKEYYMALWGNGLEAYNMYRRTCRPRNLQPAIQASPGAFIRSMFYPSDHVTLNTSAAQKPTVTVKVFWDTNGNCTY
jgi:hypothetical protein